MAYTKGDGKIDHEQLSRDLSDTVIELNTQRRELLAELKVADHALEVAGFQDVQPVRAGIRAVIAKVEKAMGVVPVTP